MNDAKMSNAINTKQSIITEKVMTVGQNTRDKSERGKQALAAQQAKADAIKETLTVKIKSASAKRDDIIKEKVAKSAVKKVRLTAKTTYRIFAQLTTLCSSLRSS